jgi:hypothetical protein
MGAIDSRPYTKSHRAASNPAAGDFRHARRPYRPNFIGHKRQSVQLDLPESERLLTHVKSEKWAKLSQKPKDSTTLGKSEK